MHHVRAAVLAAAGLALVPGLLSAAENSAAQLSPAADLKHWPRLGVNLGHRTAWGAEQLVANVLRNPGFEAGMDGALVVVRQAQGGLVSDNEVALNRDEGFWVGARYSVLTGADAGMEGVVRDSHPGPGAKPNPTRFMLDPQPSRLRTGDVLAIQGQQSLEVAPLWWTQGRVRTVRGQGRPGSPGQQAVRLDATSTHEAALLHHLDGITARAGKLLKVQGRWTFSIWARKVNGDPRVHVKFRRHGAAAWLDTSWQPGAEWREWQAHMEPRDTGPDGPVELAITVRGGSVELDDAYLGEAQPGAGGFRQATVEALRRLRPGYLRDWQGQLGDTVVNRMAEPGARHPSRYRAGPHDWQFHYSLGEFAELASAVGAHPWFVMPTVSSRAQAQAFGQALKHLWQKHRFPEVVVEFGNENWNPMFRAAGILDTEQLAWAAADLLAAVKRAAGPEVPLHFTVGAQFVRPEAAKALVAPDSPWQSVAVAPYFAFRMEREQTAADLLRHSLAEPDTHFNAWRKQLPASMQLSVYEVNAHTTLGDATEERRATWAESAGLAVALGRRLLQAADHDVSRQAVYKLSGFDTPVDGTRAGLVSLFGVTRELGPPVRLRYAGQVLAALNALDWGQTATARCEGASCTGIRARFFSGGSQLALVSSHASATAVSWDCSARPTAQWRVQWLSAGAEAPASREWGQVRQPCRLGRLSWVLPPESFAVAAAE